MSDHSVKMTYVKAEEARRLFREGMKVPELCKQFNLSDRAMRDVINGTSWQSKPSKKKTKVSPPIAKNKWDSVYNLWRNGKSNSEIAQLLDISLSYISLIQWTVKCARKDPLWAEKQQGKKYKNMAEWAQIKAVCESLDQMPVQVLKTEDKQNTEDKLQVIKVRLFSRADQLIAIKNYAFGFFDFSPVFTVDESDQIEAVAHLAEVIHIIKILDLEEEYSELSAWDVSDLLKEET